MENTMTWTATRTDRGLAHALGGTRLDVRPVATCATPAAKRINGIAPMSAFASVPAYVPAVQESHPPREPSVG